MRIDIYDTTGCTYAKNTAIQRMVKRVLKEEGKELETLNIIITDDTYLRGLNKTFLDRDRGTNVISFDLGDVSEIYVSRDRAEDAYDLHYCILHGLLHLIGYDHRNAQEEKKMHERCVEYLRDE